MIDLVILSRVVEFISQDLLPEVYFFLLTVSGIAPCPVFLCQNHRDRREPESTGK